MSHIPVRPPPQATCLASTWCPQADKSAKILMLYQRTLRLRFCPRSPVMDILHGSSPLPILVNINMAELFVSVALSHARLTRDVHVPPPRCAEGGVL
jgi:hypothetical protein